MMLSFDYLTTRIQILLTLKKANRYLLHSILFYCMKRFGAFERTPNEVVDLM